jgi:hypothetical protein
MRKPPAEDCVPPLSTRAAQWSTAHAGTGRCAFPWAHRVMFRRASGIGRCASRGRNRANRIGIALHIGERAGRPANRAPKRAHGVDHHFSPWFPPCPTPRLAGDDRLATVVRIIERPVCFLY